MRLMLCVPWKPCSLCAIFGGRNFPAVFPVGPTGPEGHRVWPALFATVLRTPSTWLGLLVPKSIAFPPRLLTEQSHLQALFAPSDFHSGPVITHFASLPSPGFFPRAVFDRASTECHQRAPACV